MAQESKVFVIDASAIIRIINLGAGIYYTTPKVLDELKYVASRTRLGLIHDKISVIQPSRESLKQVKKAAFEIGLLDDLSQADIELLAIAKDLSARYDRVIIVSDDLKIQNLAAYLCLEIKGIRKKIRWVIIRKKKCLFCGAIYNYPMEQCPDCGASEYKPITVRLKLGDMYERCIASRKQIRSSEYEY